MADEVIIREYVGKPRKLRNDFTDDSATMMRRGFEVANQMYLPKSGGHSMKRWLLFGIFTPLFGGERDTLVVTYRRPTQ